MPSFLNQAAKARGAEAKANVGAMNRAQQAYYLEKQEFTVLPATLGLSLDLDTENFEYTATAAAPLLPGTGTTAGVTNNDKSKKGDIKSYVGGTFYLTGITKTVLCEAQAPGTTALTAPAAPTAATEEAICATGTTVIK